MRLIKIATILACGGILTSASYAFIATGKIKEQLRPIQAVPSKTILDQQLGLTALSKLLAIATDLSNLPQVRINAITALGLYRDDIDTEKAISFLQNTISQHANSEEGISLLYLKASVISLAQLAAELSLNSILEVLNHPSRDIRLSCIQALVITDSSLAIPLLRDQQGVETVKQVQFAITDAIFALSTQ